MHSAWESCPPARRKGRLLGSWGSPARTTVTLYRASMWNSHLLNTHVVQTPAAQCAAGTRVMYMCLGYRHRYSAQVHWCTDAQGQCTSRWICRYSVHCAVCRAPLCTLPTGYPTRDTVQCAVCSVQYELYTNMYSLNCTIICTQYAHNVQWTNSHTLGNLVSHSSIKAINKGKLGFPGFIKA